MMLKSKRHARKDERADGHEEEPQSYEELVARAKPMEELLKKRGVDLDEILKNFPEYMKKMEYAAPTAIVHGNQIPVTGSVLISLGRVVTGREVKKAFRK